MTLSALVTSLSLVVNVVMLYLMYKGIYIPNWKIPLFISFLFGGVYLFARFILAETKTSKVSRLFTFSVTLYVAYSLGGLTYEKWKMDSMISSFSMMKISLFIFIAIIIYLNVVYIRAEISYKRKRGNIRIQEEKPKTLVERWQERNKKKEEISIQLGNSTESEERTPPI